MHHPVAVNLNEDSCGNDLSEYIFRDALMMSPAMPPPINNAYQDVSEPLEPVKSNFPTGDVQTENTELRSILSSEVDPSESRKREVLSVLANCAFEQLPVSPKRQKLQ